MNRAALLLVWLVLLVLLAAEFLFARIGLGLVSVGIGFVMVGMIAVFYMQLARAPALSRVFALAGVFWLMILLGLTGMDIFTRTDVIVPLQTAMQTRP